MLRRSTTAACALLCVFALTACGGDDAAGGTGGASGAGAGGESGSSGSGGTGGAGGTGGDSGTGGTGGTGGDSGTGGAGGTGGTGGDDTDAGMLDPDSGTDAAMPAECGLGEQDNDGDGVCQTGCDNYECLFGLCDDSTGTSVCECDELYEGDNCGTLSPPPSDGLVLWLDAQQLDTFELGGAVTNRVMRWESVLDSNDAFVQAVDNDRPQRTSMGINGRPAVRFDGITEFLDLADFDGLVDATGYEVYFVARSRNETQEGVFLAGVNGEDGTANAGQHGLLIQANGTATALRFNHRMPFAASGGVNVMSAADLLLDTPAPFRVYASPSPDTGSIGMQRDSIAIGNALGAVVAFNRVLDLTVGRLSGLQSPASRFLKGDVGEILIYATNKSNAQAAQIQNYLRAHWGLVQ